MEPLTKEKMEKIEVSNLLFDVMSKMKEISQEAKDCCEIIEFYKLEIERLKPVNSLQQLKAEIAAEILKEREWNRH